MLTDHQHTGSSHSAWDLHHIRDLLLRGRCEKLGPHGGTRCPCSSASHHVIVHVDTAHSSGVEGGRAATTMSCSRRSCSRRSCSSTCSSGCSCSSSSSSSSGSCCCCCRSKCSNSWKLSNWIIFTETYEQYILEAFRIWNIKYQVYQIYIVAVIAYVCVKYAYFPNTLDSIAILPKWPHTYMGVKLTELNSVGQTKWATSTFSRFDTGALFCRFLQSKLFLFVNSTS